MRHENIRNLQPKFLILIDFFPRFSKLSDLLIGSSLRLEYYEMNGENFSAAALYFSCNKLSNDVRED